MAARTLCSNSALALLLKRYNNISSSLNNGVYLLNKVHKNWSSSSLKFTGITFYNSRDVPSLLKPTLNFHQPLIRSYAKSRDKKKSDKGQKKKISINEEVVSEVINNETMKQQMQEAIEKLKEDYVKNLSLRSTTGSIENLPITFEGKEYILQDLAQVVRKNPKTVIINMASFPQVIPTIVQAISQSGMNLNPQQDGTTLFIPVPKVTKEHRESLAKNAKALYVKCRDNIKDIQNKYIKTVKNKEKDGLGRDTALQISEYENPPEDTVTYFNGPYVIPKAKVETCAYDLLYHFEHGYDQHIARSDRSNPKIIQENIHFEEEKRIVPVVTSSNYGHRKTQLEGKSVFVHKRTHPTQEFYRVNGVNMKPSKGLPRDPDISL